jgi:hypothetical protein
MQLLELVVRKAGQDVAAVAVPARDSALVSSNALANEVLVTCGLQD